MDFHALPRRDLQALCKRNGIRANMTNAAMADALAALPVVDGVEGYVKQPVAVPAPEVQAAPEEELLSEKLGSPLPRGRRVAVKAAQPTSADGNKEDGKEEAKRESTKQDAPAIGAERRGASRRARATAVAVTSVAEPAEKAVVAEDRQEEPKGNDLKQGANQMAAPGPVVGRRGASRRARPAALVATPAAEPAETGTGEEQMGEKQGSPVPRGRQVRVKSPQPIRQEDGEQEDEDLKRDESKDDAPAVGMGRRGASRRARPATAGKVVTEEEEDALIPRGRRVMVKSPEVIRLDDSEEEIHEDNKSKEEEEVAPALDGVRRGASRRARPAPVEAPATRRRATASRTEAEGVPVEAAPVRSTRQRRPTMKAAAAVAEKMTRRATRRVAARNSAFQKEEETEELQCAILDAGAVPAPVGNGGCEDADDVEENDVPRNEEQNEVVSETKEGVDEVVVNEDEMCMVENVVPQNEEQNEVVSEPKEGVEGVVVNEHEMLMEENAVPQNEEQYVVISEPKEGVEEVVVNEDEMLMEAAPEEEPLVTDQEHSIESALQENQFDGEQCAAHFPRQEDSPIFGVVSSTIVQVVEEDKDAHSRDGLRPLDKGIGEESHHASEDMEIVPITEVPLVSLTPGEPREGGVFTSVADHEMQMENFNELLNGTGETSEVNSEDGLIRQEGDVVGDEEVLDCSVKMNQVAEEEVKEVEVTDDMPPCSAALDKNEEETTFCTDVVSVDNLREVSMAEDEVVEEEKAPKDEVVEEEKAPKDEVVEEEKAPVINEDMPQSTDSVDEEGHFQTEIHADEQKKVDTAESEPETESEVVEEEKAPVINEDMPQRTTLVYEVDEEDTFETEIHADEEKKMVTVENEPETEGEIVEEKAPVITEDMPHSTTLVYEVDEEDHFETQIHVDEQKKMVTAENEPETEEVEEEEGLLITDDMEQCPLTVDEVVVDDNFKTDFVHDDEQKEKLTTDQVPELTSKDGEVADEEKIVVITEEMEIPHSTGTVDECVEEDHFKIDFAHADEQCITVISDKVPDVVGTEEEHGLKVENAFMGAALPQELDVIGGSSGHMASALLEDRTRSHCKSIVAVETTVSRDQEDTSVCKSSMEMNTSEPVVMQVEKGGKVAKRSMDFNMLSMRQLKATYKEKLIAKKNKEAKRVALARVDENICRSNANGQENLNLQQH